VTSQTLTILDVPVTGTAPAGSKLVVDIFTPNGQTAGNSFFIGLERPRRNRTELPGSRRLRYSRTGHHCVDRLPRDDDRHERDGNGWRWMSGPAVWLSEVPNEGTVASDGQQPSWSPSMPTR